MKKIVAGLVAVMLILPLSAISESKEELKEMTALILNLNGLLCAEVIDIRPLKMKDIYEVECIEYRGGKGRKIYIMDAAKGTAWIP